ncbi:MAG: Stp1/IreP family PP2C-type Ser/Thr phosphatase [Bacteroidetes bacterium]|jgi:protein phosphatase|nr:Stp1/IreP family PP2C-type Ser/Thr phosphatase [Bacteroidota bacterium]
MFWKKRFSKNPIHSNSEIQYRAIAVTDTGSSRNHNEDAVRFIRPADPAVRKAKGCLAIVADGMGGHASGEIASALAIDTVAEEYYEYGNHPLKALKSAAKSANETIWTLASDNQNLRGMGTTCTAVAIVGQALFIMHIGDSRAYLYKRDTIIQLSEDHTYVQELLNAGKITPVEAENHPDGNVLTKSLGTDKKRTCDIFESDYRFEPGDKLLLCSDGLYEYFSSQELAACLKEQDLGDISKMLSENVLEMGAHDNFSILLVEEKVDQPSSSNPTRVISTVK